MVGNPQQPRPTLDIPRGSAETGQDVTVVGQERPLDAQRPFIAWAESESLTIGTSVVQITEDLRNYEYAFITIETATIRFWIDGTIPTATTGHVADAGDLIELFGITELERFRAIRRDGTSATLRVTVGSRAQE